MGLVSEMGNRKRSRLGDMEMMGMFGIWCLGIWDFRKGNLVGSVYLGLKRSKGSWVVWALIVGR